jgi:hypothetical protein
LQDQPRWFAGGQLELTPGSGFQRGNGDAGIGDGAFRHWASLVYIGGEEVRSAHQRLVGNVELAVIQRAVEGDHHGLHLINMHHLEGILVEHVIGQSQTVAAQLLAQVLLAHHVITQIGVRIAQIRAQHVGRSDHLLGCGFNPQPVELFGVGPPVFQRLVANEGHAHAAPFELGAQLYCPRQRPLAQI